MKTKKILSIDGGGSRGIIPAVILNNIFDDTGIYPTKIFDVFAGTSTGGIIALALSIGVPTSDLVDLYLFKSEQIFADSFWDNVLDVTHLFGAKYNNDNLKGIADNFFGNMTMEDIHKRHDGKKIFMVPSFTLNPGKDQKKENFRPVVYNSSYIKFRHEKLTNIALRTSAAPTYLPIVEKEFIDGGVAINHPALSALSFAVSKNESSIPKYRFDAPMKKGLSWDIDTTKILSLGCGTSNNSFITSKLVSKGDWGLWQWRSHIANLMIESNVQCSEYYVRQLLPQNNYLRLQPDFSEDKCFEELKDTPLDLDVKDVDLLEKLREATNKYYELNKDEIMRIIEA
ncbi:MAG: patatin-like phospholipase/acyl hydrolase [Maribacter sp.]|jgi:patatin-like phospholipase/acyl hydrolase